MTQTIIPGAGPLPTLELVRMCLATPAESRQHKATLAELRDRWVTPDWLPAEVARLCGRPGWDLDLGAEAESTKAPLWFGPGSPLAVDAFSAPLKGPWRDLWLNPVWSCIGPWAELLCRQVDAAPGRIGSLCVPAYCDADWWHDVLISRSREDRATLIWVRGRVEYEPPALAVEHGLIKASHPTERTVIWLIHEAGFVPVDNIIDVRAKRPKRASKRPKRAAS